VSVVSSRVGTDRLVWVDCEMTGLDLTRDALIEIAVVVTDAELTPLGTGIDLVIHASDDSLDAMVPVVRDMHASSGLTDLVRAYEDAIEMRRRAMRRLSPSISLLEFTM
jgi:oligoribonuclease